MKLKEILVGAWYETKLGAGKVMRVGGTFPASIAIDVFRPFPRGVLNFVPRDVLMPIPTTEAVALERAYSKRGDP